MARRGRRPPSLAAPPCMRRGRQPPSLPAPLRVRRGRRSSRRQELELGQAQSAVDLALPRNGGAASPIPCGRSPAELDSAGRTLSSTPPPRPLARWRAPRRQRRAEANRRRGGLERGGGDTSMETTVEAKRTRSGRRREMCGGNWLGDGGLLGGCREKIRLRKWVPRVSCNRRGG